MAFTIEGPTCLTVEPGAAVQATYKILAAGSPITDTTLLITGLPYGVSATFLPSSGSPPFDSTLVVTSAPDSEVDAWVLNITAWDAESSKTMPVVLSNFPVIVTPAPPATVVTNTSTYAGGAAIIVTVDKGHFDLHEWVGIFQTDDFGAITENIWAYIGSGSAPYSSASKDLPGAPVSSYPVTVYLIAPSVAGTYHVTFFGTDDNSTRLAYSTNFTVSPASTFVPDYYASASGSSSNNGLTSSTPFRPADFWAVAAPGISLGLMDGVYTGANFMINPPVNMSGESGAPILIKAINDGGARVDGGATSVPLALANGGNNSWFVIEGIDFCNSIAAVVRIGATSDNNVVRRCCAWNAATSVNWHVFSVSGIGTLLEDVAAFGTGRKMYEYFQSGTDGSFTARRAWGMWNKHALFEGDGGSPKIDFNGGYDAYNGTWENCIAMWDSDSPGSVNGSVSFLLGTEGITVGPTPASWQHNNKYYGCIAIARSGDDVPTMLGICYGDRSTAFAGFTHCVFYADGKSIMPIQADAFDAGDASEDCASIGGCNRYFTNCTDIGTTGSTINTGADGWTVTNRSNGTSVASVPNIWNGGGTSGARVYYRYLNGSLTSVPLWDWPMDARIRAALTAAGRSPDTIFGGTGNSVTQALEAIFGAIP